MEDSELVRKVLAKLKFCSQISENFIILSNAETIKVLSEMSEESVVSSEYKGREVTLNKPMIGDVKKYKVYVQNDLGNVVKVNFGDPNMEIRRDNPAARKNFRARHHCENPGPKWKARYWSCKFWSTSTVTELLKGRD